MRIMFLSHSFRRSTGPEREAQIVTVLNNSYASAGTTATKS